MFVPERGAAALKVTAHCTDLRKRNCLGVPERGRKLLVRAAAVRHVVRLRPRTEPVPSGKQPGTVSAALSVRPAFGSRSHATAATPATSELKGAVSPLRHWSTSLKWRVAVQQLCRTDLRRNRARVWTEKQGLGWHGPPHPARALLPADLPTAVAGPCSPVPAQIKAKGCINSPVELRLPRFLSLVLGRVQEKRQSLLLRYLCRPKNNFGGHTLTEHTVYKFP